MSEVWVNIPAFVFQEAGMHGFHGGHGALGGMVLLLLLAGAFVFLMVALTKRGEK
ncbi:MAG: hypothetical protein ACREKE_02270 [bacterium]